MGELCPFAENSLLLLVVDRGARNLVSRRIGSGQAQGAGLAVRRHGNATAGSHFAVLFVRQSQRMVVDLPVRPRVRSRIAAEWVVFAVELARPLGVHGLAVSVGPIGC